MVEECALDDVVDDDVEQEIEIATAIQNDAQHAHSERKWLWVQFGCRQTHNEELMVAPCEMILAQQMFYGAKGVKSIVVCHQWHHPHSSYSLRELRTL